MCICCYFSHFKQLHQRLSVPSSCGQVSIQIIESCGSAVGQNLFHLGTRRRAVAFQVLTAEQTPGIQFHYTWTGRPLSLFFFFFPERGKRPWAERSSDTRTPAKGLQTVQTSIYSVNKASWRKSLGGETDNATRSDKQNITLYIVWFCLLIFAVL